MWALSRTDDSAGADAVSMKVDWETFPQYMERFRACRSASMSLTSLIVPPWPMMALTMPKRNEKEMATIIGHYKEAVDAGAAGWSAQRLVPESRVSVQRDYDGTPMITDILPDEFYLAMAKAMAEKGAGCIQFTQSGASETSFGIEDDFRFLEKLASTSGQPLLYSAIVVSDKHPESHKAQLKWVAEANQRGARVFGQGVTARAPVSMTLEDWNL
jgi:hypothetical protein